MEWIPLNINLMRNPVNWFLVTVVVLFAGVALGFIYHPDAIGDKSS